MQDRDESTVGSASTEGETSRALVPISRHAPGTALVAYERHKIGNLLLEEGKLSSRAVVRVLRAQDHDKAQRFGELAVRLKLVSERDVQIALCRQLGYPSIETLERQLSRELYMALAPFSRRAELLNAIVARLPKAANGSALVLAVLSADPKEGRSTFAANLALAYAQAGKRTLLIDGDLRRPRQHRLFGLEASVGLTSLRGEPRRGESELALADDTGLFGLHIVQAGLTYSNPMEVVNGDRLVQLLAEAADAFEVVIIDTAPARRYADAETIASLAARAIIVTRRNYSRLDAVRELIDSARRRGVEVIGAVLTV